MAEDLPIDIDYAKFLDWLVDRRRVSKGWHSSLKAARVLLRSAADSRPAGCTRPAPASYYELVDTLAHLEDKSRPPPFPGARDTDMLARYAHPTARAWASARSSYESGSAYLAEAAQALVRAADVEAPAIRAEMARLRETIAECARKEGPTTRAAADAQDRFKAACREMGVAYAPGLDFERAIRAAVEEQTPTLLRRAVEAGKDPKVEEALVYYNKFVRYCFDSIESESESEAMSDTPGSFRTLNAVIGGDADVLIRRHLEKDNVACSGEAGSGGVDWGSLIETEQGVDTAESGDIDWGIEIDASGAAEIDNVKLIAPNDEGGCGVEDSGVPGGIDWGDISATPAEEKQVSIAETENSLTLADGLSRERYVIDLLELKAFLMQRLAEVSRSSDSQVALVLQQAQGVPEYVRSVDAGQVEKMLAKVEFALDQIAGPSARRILGLQASSDAVERSARGLSEKLHTATRLDGSIGALADRKAAASEELRALTPEFDALASSCRVLIKRTEEKLTALYKRRSVHILGEINVIFPAD